MTARGGPSWGQVVRLVLADAHPAFADGLGMILAAEDNFTVCGVARDGCMAVELSAAQRPAVLLLDVHLPGGDPATTPAAVKAASPTTKVLLLSAQGTSRADAAAMAAGADGVVAKDGSSRQLANAIRRVVDGKQAMVAGKPHRLPDDDGMGLLRLGTLSDRELEILGLLARGWSNRRIAQQWQVSPATVRTHVYNLLVKLGVHSKLEAAAFAYQHGTVTLSGTTSWDHRRWVRSR